MMGRTPQGTEGERSQWWLPQLRESRFPPSVADLAHLAVQLVQGSLAYTAEISEGDEETGDTGLREGNAERLEALDKLQPGMRPRARAERLLALHQRLEAA